ncbi:MAG: DUF1805 domain-containing protein [Bradymonadales bacterium]|nr:MAG: DUF1805 domain-containing protein [Bradymonadales bacterium]
MILVLGFIVGITGFSQVQAQEMDWTGLSRERIALSLPLIIIKGSKGILACGYIDPETCNRTKEACAIVTGVMTHEDMLTAEVRSISQRAEELGLRVGMKGREAIEILR